MSENYVGCLKNDGGRGPHDFSDFSPMGVLACRHCGFRWSSIPVLDGKQNDAGRVVDKPSDELEQFPAHTEVPRSTEKLAVLYDRMREAGRVVDNSGDEASSLNEESPAGWYECRYINGEDSRIVTRYWDSRKLRYEPHDLVCKIERYSNFSRLVPASELTALRSQVATLTMLLPESYYNGLPIAKRLEFMVEAWRKLIIVNQELDQQVATLDKSAGRYASEAVRLTHVVCDQTENITMLEKQVATLERERDRQKVSFEVRWKADMRAIAKWRKAGTGRELTWPDHADLCVWLMDQLTAAQEQVATLKRQLGEAKRDEYLELQTISERDAAEDCIEKIYMEVTGDVLEWSSNFGCPEALDMVEQTMFTKQQELGSAMAELTAANATIAELQAEVARLNQKIAYDHLNCAVIDRAD